MKIKSNIVEAHIFRKIEDKIEFLALKRSQDGIYPNIWQMVTGAIHDNEKAYKTAVREILEETELVPKKLWALPNINSFYSAAEDSIVMIPVFAAEVAENSKITLSDEHSEFRWVDKDEMIQLLAWPGQRKSVEILYDYFSKETKLNELIEIKI
ncbi:MAG: NUDIX pyrophosphatase [Bacteroidota bacterium]